MDRLGIDVQVLSANPLTMFHGIDAATATALAKQFAGSIRSGLLSRLIEKPDRETRR